MITQRISEGIKKRFYEVLRKDKKLYKKVKYVEEIQNFLLSKSKKFAIDCKYNTFSINKCTEITLGRAIWYFERDILLKKPIDEKYVKIVHEIDKSGIKVDKYNHLKVIKKYFLR